MAQTKRKRSSKHRGNAAGQIEARGRTGRRPTTTEKGKTVTAAEKKRLAADERRDRPPSWTASLNRALIAAVAVAAISVVVFHYAVLRMVELMPVVLAAYIPLGYYTDHFLYRRRQRQKSS
jgi:Flp pilus assembly protein TadB